MTVRKTRSSKPKAPPAQASERSPEQEDDDDGERLAHTIADEMVAGFRAQERFSNEILEICERVKLLLKEAQTGSQEALSMLHHLAKTSTEALNSLPPDHPCLQSISANEYLWPILMPGYVKTKLDPRVAYLQKLGLGRTLPIDPQKYLRCESDARLIVEHEIAILLRMRGPTPDSPAARMVPSKKAIHELGLRECDPWKSTPTIPDVMALQDLTADKASIDRWFAAIKVLILQQTGGNPTSEEFPRLRVIGAHHAAHGEAKPGSRSAEANIKQRFFEVVKHALEKVVHDR